MPTKKVKPIYVITTMLFGYKYASTSRSKDGTYHSFYKITSPSQRKYFTIVRERTWGWYPTLEQAQEAVEHNYADLYEEGYYPQAVIEEIHVGVLHGGNIPKEWWYQSKPKEYDSIIDFMNRMKGLRAHWGDIDGE